jgi:molybdate transport system regulatory protein
VPVTIVRDLLGHSSLNTTAIYLRMSAQEAKMILKDKGLI